MSKVETASKVSLELTIRKNLGRRDAIPDIVHRPLRSPERVKVSSLVHTRNMLDPTTPLVMT